jgi:ornithine carbamoyltransferase
MGQERERAKRKQDFAAYQVNTQLMAHAPAEALFLHCLPAHRGEEVTDEVIDGRQSIVIEQAANRMHVQKGILVWLLAAQG